MLWSVRTVSDPPLTLGAWLRHDAIQAHVNAEQPNSVIEFGCGLGAMGARLADGREYVGVEPDEESRRQAASRLPHHAELIARPEDVGDRTVDLVAAFEVLEHIDDDVAALAQWRSHLRPGGTVLASVPAFQAQFGPFDDMVGHLRRYEPGEVPDLLRAAGFEPLSVVVTGFPLGLVLERVRQTIASRRAPAADTAADRTAASARVWQPASMGLATRAASAPFRTIQKRQWDRGIGLVMTGRNPAS